MIKTSKTQKPPPHPFYGDSYERGKDPWHVDAFKGTSAEGMGSTAERGEGWFLIDGHGNAIGFVPDGTNIGPGSRHSEPSIVVIDKRDDD